MQTVLTLLFILALNENILMITDSLQSLQRRKCFPSAFPRSVNILNSCLTDIIIITEFTLISLKKKLIPSEKCLSL